MTLKAAIQKFHMILSYFANSVLSLIVDTAVVWLLLDRFGFPLVTANTIGVVVGFLIGFVMHVRHTFKMKYSPLSFAVYFSTFLLGLVLADCLIAASYRCLRGILSDGMVFLFSKGVSVVVPFFIMYFIRKYAYEWVHKREARKK